MVAEGPNMNLGIITEANELVVSLCATAILNMHFVVGTLQTPTDRHHRAVQLEHQVPPGA